MYVVYNFLFKKTIKPMQKGIYDPCSIIDVAFVTTVRDWLVFNYCCKALHIPLSRLEKVFSQHGVFSVKIEVQLTANSFHGSFS